MLVTFQNMKTAKNILRKNQMILWCSSRAELDHLFMLKYALTFDLTSIRGLPNVTDVI